MKKKGKMAACLDPFGTASCRTGGADEEKQHRRCGQQQFGFWCGDAEKGKDFFKR